MTDAYNEELTRIRLKHPKRKLLSKNVEYESRPKNSVLHGRFEWNDKEGAYQYRLFQARQIIRTAVVIKKGEPPTKKFACVESGNPEESYYQDTDILVKNVSEYSIVVNSLSEKINGIQRTLTQLEKMRGDENEDGPVILAIHKALTTASGLAAQLH